ATNFPAIEQIIEAMAEARNHQQSFHRLTGIVEIIDHAEFVSCFLKTAGNLFKAFALLGNKADPHEEFISAEIIELGAVNDVTPHTRKISRNSGNYTEA